MKILGLLAAGALPIGVLARTATIGVKETLMANSNSTVFFADTPLDLPSSLLVANDVSAHALSSHEYSDILGPDGRIKCTESGSIQDNGEVAVVLAFSKCLDDNALSIVEQWVNQVKTTIKTIASTADLEITFQSTMVPGACEERSEKEKQGLEDPAMKNQGGPEIMMLADEVSSDDLQRLEAFPGLGSVVDLANDDVTLAVDPIAVISFVTGEKSYGEVMQFEAKAHVSKVFNFHICHSGVNCDGQFENCITLQETVDLFMYNPFTVTRSLQCAHLDGGVPVTYKDDYGNRQCFCSCPAGHIIKENEYGNPSCKQVVEDVCPCVWAKCNGFKHNVETDEAVCSFKDVATNWGLPVPFPTDGYVADKRDTLNEGANLNPRITLTVNREQDAEYKGKDLREAYGYEALPLTFADVVGHYAKASSFSPLVSAGADTNVHNDETTWKDYQLNRDAHINDIEFTSYGKYHLEMSAYDYFSDATCKGCLVIVDKNRPTATTTCPDSFCDYVADPVHCTDSAELTQANLDKAGGLTDQFFDYADKATNDACSVNNRCDHQEFSRRDFFDEDYKKRGYDKAHQCFDKDTVIGDLLLNGKTKTNPLVVSGDCDKTAQPVPAGQCTRCCKMETHLKEWWTDYRCGSDYDARSCSGDEDQKCSFKQCLVMNGDTLATVTASITPQAKTDSEAVLAKVEQEGYQTVTQIHHALDCTSFGGDDGRCDFTAKLSELIDTTETLNFDVSGRGEPTDYVFWRYKLISEGEDWSLWKTAKHENYGEITYDNDDVLTFTNPETKITLEAWTQCGLVRRFFFYVHLHVNSEVDVCDKFNDMWYQTSVSRLPIGNGMCAYPGSDFAELTFDFHPNAGLQYSRTELRMKVTKVECTGALEKRDPAKILTVTENSPEIVTRFAVAMLEKATTEAATDFHVECEFTYKQFSGTERKETCKRDFSIKDCKGPAFDTPNAVCEYEACAGNAEAGLYEACGGTIIRADEKCTIVETGEKPCCQGCTDTEITCTPLLDLPNADADIKRCEPGAGGSYSNNYGNYAAVLLTQAATEHPAALALLSATTLIAVAALVVVRRRVVHSYSAQTADDAYYPLLH